jgi:hypothetical protein
MAETADANVGPGCSSLLNSGQLLVASNNTLAHQEFFAKQAQSVGDHLAGFV